MLSFAKMKKNKSQNVSCNPGAGAVYGLGLIGVAIYYLQDATTFMEGVIGILKAFVWPAFLAFKLFEFLKV